MASQAKLALIVAEAERFGDLVSVMLDLARIEHLVETGGGRRRLEVVGEIRHLALELIQIHERVDLERRHEHAVVVLARRFDAKAEVRAAGRKRGATRRRGGPAAPKTAAKQRQIGR